MILWFPHGEMCIRNTPSISTASATHWVGWTFVVMFYTLNTWFQLTVLCLTSVSSVVICPYQQGLLVAQYTAHIAFLVLKANATLFFQRSIWSFLSFSTSETLFATGLCSENVQSLFRCLGTCTLGACRMLHSFWPMEQKVKGSSATSGDTPFLENMSIIYI